MVNESVVPTVDSGEEGGVLIFVVDLFFPWRRGGEMETLPTCVARRGNSMQLMRNFFPLRVTLLLVDSASLLLFVGVFGFAFPGLFDDDPVMVSSFMEMCCERMHDMTGRWCVCLFHLMHQFQRVLYRKIVFFSSMPGKWTAS